MAAAITEKYGKAEGEVALITHLPGVGSLEARNKGFKEELAAKYPGLKLVADKVSDGQATTGREESGIEVSQRIGNETHFRQLKTAS